ncbi:hypothetical protein QTP88_007703 [Uroleucon formosanum]
MLKYKELIKYSVQTRAPRYNCTNGIVIPKKSRKRLEKSIKNAVCRKDKTSSSTKMNQDQRPATNNCQTRDSSRECCCIICYDKCVCVKFSPCEHKFCSACVERMAAKNINNCQICRRQVEKISRLDLMSTD